MIESGSGRCARMKILQQYTEKSQSEQWIYFLCMMLIIQEYCSRIPELLYPVQILYKILLIFKIPKSWAFINNLEENINCFFYRNLAILLANNGHMWEEFMFFKYFHQVTPRWIYKNLLLWNILNFQYFRFSIWFAINFFQPWSMYIKVFFIIWLD